MPEDWYMVAIAALLPLTAGMLILQVNPYHALVIRGILGAVAALVYALFGAADVALTEALVGTMLSITLYAVAVRSSMSMRLGILKPQAAPSESLLLEMRKALSQYHMRLELVPYANLRALQSALTAKEIHTAYISAEQEVWESAQPSFNRLPQLQTRVQRLYDIMEAELPPGLARLTDVSSARLSPVKPLGTATKDSIGEQL